MHTIKDELLNYLRRDDLLRASMLLGKVQDSSFNVEPFVERVMEISARVWHRGARLRKDPVHQLQAINHVLFKELEIQAKTERYKQVVDDPSRFYLHLVLETKITSPLVLTILYSILCSQIGVAHEILAVPASFFLQLKEPGTNVFVDVFDSGKVLTPEEYQRKFRSAMQRNRLLQTNLFERLHTTQLVGRLAQQLKHVYILKGTGVEALRAVEVLTAIYPNSPELTRDRGILYCEMEYFSKAVEDLRFYLKERPHAEDVGEIKKLAGMLKGYREIVN